MNTREPAGCPFSLSSTMDSSDNKLTYSIQKKHNDGGAAGGKNSRNVDLKKFVENASCSIPDDMTAATALTSFSSFGDATTASLCTKNNRRGSILKSPSSAGNASLSSFGDTATAAFLSAKINRRGPIPKSPSRNGNASFGGSGESAAAAAAPSTPAKTNRRGSILKQPSSSAGGPKAVSSPPIERRISFSAETTQVFTIESKEEYFGDLFYDQESLADFWYQALMWEAGMVDEDGTPNDVLKSANETNDKFRKIDEMNGSLDFDVLLLDDDGPEPAQDKNGALVQGEADRLEKEIGRIAIQDLGRSMGAPDQQRESAGDLFCDLRDWDDFDMEWDYDDISSDGEDEELDENLDRPFSELNIGIPKARSSKEKFEGQRSQTANQGKQKNTRGCILGNSRRSFRVDSEDDGTGEPSQRSSTYDGRSQQSLRSFTLDGNSQRSQRSSACDGNRQRSQRSIAYDSNSQRSEISVPYYDESQRSRSVVYNDESQRSRSVPYNDESQRSRRSVRETSESAKVRMSLTSLSDIFLSTRSLDVSDHKTENGEADKRARLMAKMRGLRESLRSIQSMQYIDSDDDDSDGGSFCQEQGGDNKIIDGIDTKNLKRSLITKHKVFSPKPNGKSMPLKRLKSVEELSVPEI